MQDHPDQPSREPDFAAASAELKDGLSRGAQSATEAIHDARDEITRKADEYLQEAKETLGERAEGVQNDISSNLSAFGGALRAASEHLANNSQRGASKFVLDAAGGVERLSSSLKSKPFGDVISDLRSFGRDNSAALIAGSVLAGLAMARFLKSSASNASEQTTQSGRQDQDSDDGARSSFATDRGQSSFASDPNDGWVAPATGASNE